MKKLLLILFCMPLIGFGQGWIQTYGTEAAGSSVQQTNDGGYIISGHSTTTAEIYLIKTDSIGNLQWDNTFGGGFGFEVGFGQSVRQTNDGGYIISGQRSLQPSIGNTITLSDSSEVLLIKTDNLGNQQWQQVYGIGVVTNDFGNSVQQTIDGGYIIYATKDGYRLWLIKTDNLGNLQWNNTFSSGTPFFSSFGKQTTDGGYILAGNEDSFSTGTATLVKLTKTNSQGDTSWTQILPNFLNMSHTTYQPYSIDTTNNGGYIIAGVSSTIDTTANQNQLDGFLIKTDSTGSLVWNKAIGYFACDANQTTDGGYICMGTKVTNFSVEDLYATKTDANGNTIWTKIYTGTGNIGYAPLLWSGNVEQTTDGGYIMTGYYADTINYNGGVLLIKTDANGNATSTFNIPIPNANRKLQKIVDILGRETKGTKNEPLFYIYDDGTVEKRIIIE